MEKNYWSNTPQFYPRMIAFIIIVISMIAPLVYVLVTIK
jgi:hypothetical protein